MDGRVPDGVGVFWLPATAVGEGDATGGEAGDAVATTVDVGAVDGVDVPEGGDEAVALGEAARGVALGEAPWTAADDRWALGELLGLAWFGAGLSAIVPVSDAAKAAAPSATARTVTIGTSPIRLPRGCSCRQFGQKPETGVNA